jgi:hypothetical protein
VETIDGEELDRLLLDAAVPTVIVPVPETRESGVAARIAAAEAHGWDDGVSDPSHESDAGPPVAAS